MHRVQLYKLVSSFPPIYRGECDQERGRRSSVKKDGVGVSVGYLCHVFQDILFSDDSQQPPNDTERKEKTRLLHIKEEVIESRESSGLVC